MRGRFVAGSALAVNGPRCRAAEERDLGCGPSITVFVDNSTTPVTFWVGSNHDHRLVKVEPLD